MKEYTSPTDKDLVLAKDVFNALVEKIEKEEIISPTNRHFNKRLRTRQTLLEDYIYSIYWLFYLTKNNLSRDAAIEFKITKTGKIRADFNFYDVDDDSLNVEASSTNMYVDDINHAVMWAKNAIEFACQGYTIRGRDEE